MGAYGVQWAGVQERDKSLSLRDWKCSVLSCHPLWTELTTPRHSPPRS